jgi:hypothetical protein
VSGYIGAVSFLEKLADVLKELKDKNPNLVKLSFQSSTQQPLKNIILWKNVTSVTVFEDKTRNSAVP